MAQVASKNSAGFLHIPKIQDKSRRSIVKIIGDYCVELLGERFLWSMKSVLTGTAILLFFLTPASLDFANFGLAEGSYILARNLIFYVVCTGALHLYFHSFRMQGDKFRYFQKNIGKKSEFLFASQLKDNLCYSVLSGVTIWSANEMLYYWLYANGALPKIQFGDSVIGTIWFIALLLIIPHIQAIHFFIIHKFLHWPPMYSRFHAQHHRNISLIPWSGISMHPVEHLLYLFPWIVFFILPSHPIHMLFFMHYLTVGASFSHCGYERLHLGGNISFPIAGFYHQLHHKLYNCNYGNPDFPLDEMFKCNETGARFASDN